MYYRCELLINGLKYRVTDDLENWDEVKASFKRNDYDGVIRTFSNKFSFAGDARKLLLKQYDEDYLNASASIIISTRNNSWLYNERFSCALNFSTLQDNGRILQINAVDDSVASMIKAKRGTQYEYPVEEVKSPIPLVYDGLELSESAKWLSTGDIYNGEIGDLLDNDKYVYANFSSNWQPMQLYTEATDINIGNATEILDQSYMAFQDQYLDGDGNVADGYKDENTIVTALKSVKLSVDINFNFFIRYQSLAWGSAHGVALRLAKIGTDNKTTTVIIEHFWTTPEETLQEKEYSEHFDVPLDKGEKLVLMCKLECTLIGGGSARVYYPMSSDSRVTVSWKNRINPVEMDVIKPDTLLNRLLKSINGEKDGLTGVIEGTGDRRLDNCMLLAAESARKIPGAKIYTSFTKFANWMSYVFGYAYDISGNTVTFRHRSKYFSDDVVKRIDDLSDYEMKVNSALVYSRIRIGFDKQDYDTANGKDEFRFTNEYTTGVTMTDNSLEMISPYRADAYGIEFLADKIGEDTTDNESDTDLFMVGVKSDSSGLKYILNRDYLMGGVLSPDTMFNAMFSPSSMVLANEAYIGSSVEMLTFASSDGNSDVGIDGMGESRDIILSKRMFTVAEVEFETSDVELPEDLTGIVELEYQGKVVQGYYQQADYNFTKSQSSKVTLIVKNLNSL
nr:MAG TPA: hypothetical protein [Caudoviricetes sp.]